VTVREAREKLELQIATLSATTAAYQAMNTPLQNVTKEREAATAAIDALVVAVLAEVVEPALVPLKAIPERHRRDDGAGCGCGGCMLARDAIALLKKARNGR